MHVPVLSTEPAEPTTGVGVLEREETREQLDRGEGDRFAHYVRRDRIEAAAASGAPVVALCGKVWVPGRDPKKYPVCPMCKQIMEEIMGGGEGNGQGPRWPFGRGGSRR